MAQIDTSIYGNLLRPAPSLMDNVNALDSADLQRTQLAGAKLNLIGQQQSQADQQAVRALYQRPGFDPSTQQGMAALSAASPTTALTTRKAILDNAKTQADTTLAGSNSDKALQEAQKMKTQHAIDVQAQIAQAAGAATDQASWDRGLQIASTLGADISQVPKVFDPATAKQIHDQALTGVQQLDAHFKQITADETARHNKTSEADTRRGQDITATTSRRGQDMENKRAGYDANGNMVDLGAALGAPPVAAPAVGAIPKTPGGGPPAPVLPGAPVVPAAPAKSPLQGLVDSIGSYQAAESVALGRMPAVQKSQVLEAVKKQYPDYDPSNFGARQKAAKDFGTGKQGDALRSFAVAGEHLDQLEKLADAIHNGDTPFINRVANAYGIQTGQAPVAVFNAVKNIVGQEVVKSIVAGGGGEAERKAAGDAFDPNSSPGQFKGTIGAVKHVMQAQQEGLLTQRRGLGLSDKTLPEYFKKAKPGDEAALHSAAEAILKGTK